MSKVFTWIWNDDCTDGEYKELTDEQVLQIADTIKLKTHPTESVGRIAMLEAAVAKLAARAENHESADSRRKKDLKMLDENLVHIKLRLDNFTAKLSGDPGSLESVIAALECNQSDTGTAYESLNERLDAIEIAKQEAVTPETETKSEMLFVRCPRNGWDITHIPADFQQVQAEFTRMGGKVETGHNPRHIAFMSAVMKCPVRVSDSPPNAFRLASDLARQQGFEYTEAWLLSLAAALEQPADPASTKGCCGEEHGL